MDCRGQGMVEVVQHQPIKRTERLTLARRRILLPSMLLLAVLTFYAYGLVLASTTAISIALTIPCGMAIGMLFIIGHDARHNAFTVSTRLNQVIGRLAFLPALHSFSLWDLAHNRTHHRYNNIRGIDYVWEPMTAAEYQGAPWPRRVLYRICRTPAGVGIYYLLHIWAPRLLLPLPGFIDRMRAAYALDSVLVLSFFLLQLWTAVTLGEAFDKGLAESILLGVVLPFLVWSGFMSFVVFLHHTHPAVRWYPSVAAWRSDHGALHGSVRVRFPWPFRPMVLGIMEHHAHHQAPGVPLYNLPCMQQALETQTPLVTWQFSWGRMFVFADGASCTTMTRDGGSRSTGVPRNSRYQKDAVCFSVRAVI
jgi:acyl-lipid omega-6 desaturase (Delta-12 desaturase)